MKGVSEGGGGAKCDEGVRPTHSKHTKQASHFYTFHTFHTPVTKGCCAACLGVHRSFGSSSSTPSRKSVKASLLVRSRLMSSS